MFREDIAGAIPKLVSKLEDNDSDVREAAIEGLEAFTIHGWSFESVWIIASTSDCFRRTVPLRY